MPYDPSKLQAADPTDVEWALAWVRFLTRDTIDPFERSDAELYAVITTTAWTHNATPYYRPHYAAASLIEGDPDRPQAESTLGASVTHRDARQVASAIRRDNAWVDALIEGAAGARPPSGRTLAVVW